MKEIYLAGGCFWGTQAYFAQIEGVTATHVGYANGEGDGATYQTIADTNHAETVYVAYDPAIVGLSFLLEMYYNIIDPTSINRQGHDVGTQYRTGIYYTDSADLGIIEPSIMALEEHLGCPVAIEIAPLHNYTKAEDYHQDYLQHNPNGYCHIGKAEFAAARTATPRTDDTAK